MSNQRFSKSEWIFLLSLFSITALVIWLMICGGWFDFEHNKLVMDCLKAGNELENCE
jgi:hypothetical protein